MADVCPKEHSEPVKDEKLTGQRPLTESRIIVLHSFSNHQLHITSSIFQEEKKKKKSVYVRVVLGPVI